MVDGPAEQGGNDQGGNDQDSNDQDSNDQGGNNQPGDDQRGDGDIAALIDILRRHPPFDGLPDPLRLSMSQAARIEHFGAGEVILDAFTVPSVEVFVVVTGSVEIWNSLQYSDNAADDRLGPGGIFGFSAMLVKRSVGPLAVAADRVTVAAIPASVVEPAFASPTGAQFLAEQGAIARQGVVVTPYSSVDDLILTEPLIVDIADQISDVARLMTDRGLHCAAVRLGVGHFGLVTDAQLRRRVLVDGLPTTAPAGMVLDDSIPTAVLGDSAAEALISMLDRNS